MCVCRIDRGCRGFEVSDFGGPGKPNHVDPQVTVLLDRPRGILREA